MADLKTLRGVAAKDRKMIEEAEALLGPEPTTMGFVKNLFWGHVREELLGKLSSQQPAGAHVARQVRLRGHDRAGAHRCRVTAAAGERCTPAVM